jgi:hypothetical protein
MSTEKTGDPEKTGQPDKPVRSTGASGQPSSEPKSGATPGGHAPIDARAEEGRTGGLEQIREILFGAIYRDVERRLALADAHLAARAHELEQETRRRTEVLETHLRKETEALTARLERQLVETGDALRSMTREYRDAFSQLEQRLAKIEEASAQGQRELRHQLLEQAKSFLDEMHGQRRELLATMHQELGLAEGEFAEEHGEAERSRH